MRTTFLCAIISFSVFSGCGSKPESESAANPETAANEPSPQPTASSGAKKADNKNIAEPRPLFRPRPIRDDPQCLAKLQELGADLQFNKSGLVYSAVFTSGDIKDVMTGIKGLKECRILRFAKLSMTDERLTDLSQLPLAKNLEELDVSGNKKIGNASVGTLAAFPELLRLNLNGTNVSDLGGLKALKKLQKLDLSWTPVNGKQIQDLTQLTALQDLDISWTDVDAEALQALRKIGTLKSIAIEGSVVLDTELEKLASTFDGILLRGLPIKEQEEKPKQKADPAAQPARPNAPPQAFAAGDPAPEIQGSDIDGKKFKLSDYRGKVVLLDFWGNWCIHCRRLYPHARELVDKHKEAPFAMLGVNSDRDRELLQQIVKTEKLAWRSWFDGGPDGPIATEWGIRDWPTLYLIDHKGVIRHIGLRGDALDKALAKLITEAKEKAKVQKKGKKKPVEKDDSL